MCAAAGFKQLFISEKHKFSLFGKVIGLDRIDVSFVFKKKILILSCRKFKIFTWLPRQKTRRKYI